MYLLHNVIYDLNGIYFHTLPFIKSNHVVSVYLYLFFLISNNDWKMSCRSGKSQAVLLLQVAAFGSQQVPSLYFYAS